MRRIPSLGVALAALALLVTGCGATDTDATPVSASASTSTGTHVMPNGTSMADMDMPATKTPQPTAAATMICGDELRDVVAKTFDLADPPTSTHRWDGADRLFSCTYRIPAGNVQLSVQDSLDETTGRQYFRALRSSLADVHPLTGMENFGFPAFGTPEGDIVFLKDGKTLRVDTSALPRDAAPGFSPEETAYKVAAAVIACWTE